ncbi:hypothetical protein [Clostridium sp.]|uniref:hypothetical protein n=1 Tax=Clostridium sp. TaxID=1506 RepID=UPI00284715B2|nr:hypothetical protein [Clostridium sp.]MDR3594254.1 hypothetical protein [Clostridium sp.]
MDKNKVKIGARILSDNALGKLLPNNKIIMEQIELIRDVAKEANIGEKKYEQLDREFERHFNNIFSILGGRGSGKTSVLLTMKYNITKDHSDTDIILPLIVPEKMGQASDVLGWILGFLGDVVDGIEKTVYGEKINLYSKGTELKGYFEGCRKKEDNPLREKYNELLKQYRYTKPDYRKILINQFLGLNEYIENSKNILDSDQKLVVKFEELLEELFKVKKKENKINNGNDKQPLLFVFFDDVDLSTERCAEVLNVALRYLSNSNVVVFVAGNYMTFSEVLTIDALKKDGILDKDMMESSFIRGEISANKTALDIRSELTQDYLKKVMPPAFRYHIPLVDDKAKAEFIYSTEDDETKEDNSNKEQGKYDKFYELISEKFNLKDKDEDENNNFIKHNGAIIYSYFKIFDNTQRGMMNVYYFLHSMSKEKEEKNVCLQLDMFLNTIVQSSSILSKHENNIKKIISIKDSFEATFIDYEYIKYLLESRTNSNQKQSEEDNQMFVEEMLTICILACFIENIMVSQEKAVDSEKIHGVDIFISILEKINGKFAICPKLNDFSEILHLYTLVSDSIPNRNMSKIEYTGSKNYFLSKYFEKLGCFRAKKEGEPKKEESLFEKAFKEDKTWVKDKIDIILDYGKEDIWVIKEVFEENYKKTINMIPYESLVNIMYNNVVWEFTNIVKAEGNIKEYLKDKLNENIFQDKKLTEEKIKNNEIIDLKKTFENLYIELRQDNRLKKDIENKKRIIDGFKEQNNEDLKQGIGNNIQAIREAREYVIERIEELKLETDKDSRRKTMWENAVNRGQIQYIPFDGNKTGASDKKEVLCRFSINDVGIIEKYNLSIENLKLDGYLIKLKDITPRLTNFTKVYFKEIEELKLLEEYILDEIEAIIELDNKINKTSKTERELNALVEKKQRIGIEVKEENVKRLDLYLKYKSELEIEAWENSYEFYGDAIKKLSLSIYKYEKSDIINEKLDINEEKKEKKKLLEKLFLIEEFYESKINEISILFNSVKKKLIKKSDVFQPLYYLMQQTLERDIMKNIGDILDDNLDIIDFEILESIIKKLVDENEENTSYMERNLRRPSVGSRIGKYIDNSIEIKRNINLIQIVSRGCESGDIYDELQIDIAQEIFKDVFINYIRVKGMIEINERADSFYENFKKIKAELLTTTDVSLKNYLEIKRKSQEQVELNV